MLPIVYLPAAEAHLSAIEEYIADQVGPLIAERYVRKIVARCELLAALPLGGRLRKEANAGLRSVSFKGRVTIFYRISDDAILVAGIRYGSQDEARFLAALAR